MLNDGPGLRREALLDYSDLGGAEDPVTEILALLRALPLERVVACLVVIVNEAAEKGSLTAEDRRRIALLIQETLGSLLDKAA
jgi:hypothetical protein